MRDTSILTSRRALALYDDVAERTNDALEQDQREVARAAREELFAWLERVARDPNAQTDDPYYAIKRARNELTRVYMTRGWYEDAAGLMNDALEGLPIDRTCPNREAVIRQALGRVLAESGRLDEGAEQLERAVELSTAFLLLIDEGAEKFPNLGRARSPMPPGHVPAGGFPGGQPP